MNLALGRFDALSILDRVGRILCLTVGGVLGIGFAVFDTQPADAWLFWDAGHSAHYYGAVWSMSTRYIYPPPLAQLLGFLPWQLFIVPWMLLIFGCLWYATRWLAAPILLVGAAAWLAGGIDGPLASPLLFSSIGNPQAVIAAAIIVGFRRPAAWAFVLLTKIGPGVGLLWFAFRREWRNLGVAVGVTSAVVAVSFIASPSAWAEFVRFAIDNYATPSPVPIVPIPLFIRLPMAIALIYWGARVPIVDGPSLSRPGGRHWRSISGRTSFFGWLPYRWRWTCDGPGQPMFRSAALRRRAPLVPSSLDRARE